MGYAKRFVKEYVNYLIKEIKVGDADKAYQIQKAYYMCDKGMITQTEAMYWITKTMED